MHLLKMTSSVLTLGLAIQASTVLGSIIAGPITSPINGHSYYFTSELTWPQAEAEAIALGGHLATIRSSAEDDWLLATFSPMTNRVGVHIGLNDIVTEGSWVWSSGEATSYLHWGPGEPNSFGNEDWGEMFVRDYNALHAGEWNDGSVNNCGIVEVVPEPYVSGYLALISLYFFRRRRRVS
ncbi:MAG: C-type lectin domain-containing protein [Planctomycetota bacterium]